MRKDRVIDHFEITNLTLVPVYSLLSVKKRGIVLFYLLSVSCNQTTFYFTRSSNVSQFMYQF
jgi:hypothetical protein